MEEEFGVSGALLASKFHSTVFGSILLLLTIIGGIGSLLFIDMHYQNRQQLAFKVRWIVSGLWSENRSRFKSGFQLVRDSSEFFLKSFGLKKTWKKESYVRYSLFRISPLLHFLSISSWWHISELWHGSDWEYGWLSVCWSLIFRSDLWSLQDLRSIWCTDWIIRRKKRQEQKRSLNRPHTIQ